MSKSNNVVFSKKQAAEFAIAMNANRDALHLLKLKYLEAQLKEIELKELFIAVYNDVLKEQHFVVSYSKNSKRTNLKQGDRITNEADSFLMSDADHEIYLNLAQKQMQARGYVDDEGYYLPGFNGAEIRLNAENKLIDFQISLFPEDIRETFKDIKKNYTLKHKFLEILMRENKHS